MISLWMNQTLLDLALLDVGGTPVTMGILVSRSLLIGLLFGQAANTTV